MKLRCVFATAFLLLTTIVYARIDLGAGRQATVGAYVYDLRKGDVVLADNADVAMTPASVVKSFTTASALQTLGKDWRFETRVALTGTRAGKGVWNGDLVIIPGGDPTLESDEPSGTKGLCGEIAQALKDLGVSKINGSIIVADTVPDQGQAPDWENEDTVYPYGAGWFNLNWNDNTFTIWPASGRTKPHVPDLEIVRQTRRYRGIDRGTGSERLYVYAPRTGKSKGRKGRRRSSAQSNWSTKTTMPFPYKVFVHALREQLAADEITVTDKKSHNSADIDELLNSTMTPVLTHRSLPLVDIMRDLMYRSDNTFAEGVLRAQAPGASRDSAISCEMQLWRANGLDLDGQLFKDGSGLSRTTSVTPRFIGNVLQYMAQSDYRDDYVGLFARAGVDGTLKHLLKDTPLMGRLALKSGSMSGVRCYAGYALDEEGLPSHVVVLFVNRYSCSGDNLRKSIENFLLDTFAPLSGVKVSEEN